MQRFRYSLLAPSALLAATLVVTACAAARPAGPAASARSGSHAIRTAARITSASLTSSSSRSSATSCDAGRWRSAPVTVTRSVPVPPTPVIKAVRTAKHPECGYDRLVLDVSGRLPGYTIRYVAHVIADPSGKIIKLPGRHFLVITLRPANAHTRSANTISRRVQVPGFPMLRAWVLAGDDEGVVSFGVGLKAHTKIRVGELHGRIFIDFKA
jgi:hypothetical protein